MHIMNNLSAQNNKAACLRACHTFITDCCDQNYIRTHHLQRHERAAARVLLHGHWGTPRWTGGTGGLGRPFGGLGYQSAAA